MTPRSSPSPLRALRVSVVLFAFLGLMGYLCRDHCRTYRARQIQLNNWNQQRDLEHQLDCTVEMQFDAELSLDEWLTEWSRQTQIPCRIEANQPQNLGQQKIALALKPMSARDALQTLARVYQFGWTSKGERVEVYPSGIVDDPLIVETYPLPLGWGDAREQVSALRSLIQVGPETLHMSEGSLVCIERHPVQLQVQSFLRRLDLATERAAALSQHAAALDPSAWEPILLDDDPAALRAAVAALTRPIALDVQEVSLRELAQALSRAIDYPVVFERDSLANFQRRFGGAKVSCRVQHATLTEVLQTVAPHQGLRAEPVASGRAIMIYDQGSKPENNQAICLAYPVNDFLPNPADLSARYELLKVIFYLVDEGVWHDMHGQSRINGGLCGPLLVVNQRWSAHQQLQALLRALRAAKGGVPGASVRTQLSPPLPSAINKALDQPAALKYQNVALKHVAAELKTRFDLQLVIPSDHQTIAETKVWCHLPERPLRDNLRLLLNAYQLTVAHVQGELRVLDSLDTLKADYAPRTEIEVHNMSAFRGPGRNVVNDFSQFLHVFGEGYDSEFASGEGRLHVYGNLLILSHYPLELNRSRLAIRAVREHYLRSAAEVRETALRDGSRPLIDHERIVALEPEVAWHDELNRRLSARDTLKVENASLLPLLWQLADKHSLPIIHPGSPWTDVDPPGEVSLKIQDEPVRDILQRLLSGSRIQLAGEQNTKRWFVRDAVVQTWDAPFGKPGYRVDWLFDVGDLLRPGGELFPGQLYRTLNEQAFASPDTYNNAKLMLHLGRFLGVKATPAHCEKFRDALHALRTGELKPLPGRQGDATDWPKEEQRSERWQDDLDFRFRGQDAGEALERRAEP